MKDFDFLETGLLALKSVSILVFVQLPTMLKKSLLMLSTAFDLFTSSFDIMLSILLKLHSSTIGTGKYHQGQIPLEFEFLAGGTYTYEMKGAATVQVRSQAQATIQVTTFANGISRIKPFIVFHGKGTKLLQAYPGQYTLRNTIPRMLVLDVHKAQETQAVKDVIHRMHTLPVMVPAGCTSLVQPLDVCLNKPLKDRIRALADQHYVDHILEWSAQKHSASERRI